MKKTILLIMTLTLMSMMLSAQSRGGGGGMGGPGGQMAEPAEQVAMYDEELDLTEEQEASFLEILTDFEGEMQEMMEGESRPDRDKMMTLMEERDEELTAILTRKQARLFAKLNEEMMGGPGGGAPQGGGPERG